MGGCYSAGGEKTFLSPKHKQPKDWPQTSDKTFEPFLNPNKSATEFEAAEDGVINESPVQTDNSSKGDSTSDQRPVVASDSGIESIGAPHEDSENNQGPEVCIKCHKKLIHKSWIACQVCGQLKVVDAKTTSKILPETYCSCGPRHAGRSCWQGSVCKTHLNSPKMLRHSDILSPNYNSEFRKMNRFPSDKRTRFSWKSSDSLDIGTSITTTMDRVKSEALDIFGDDISLRAPLAVFDSVDTHLNFDTERHRFDSDGFCSCSVGEVLPNGICLCDSFASDVVMEVDKLLARANEDECEILTAAATAATEARSTSQERLSTAELCNGQVKSAEQDNTQQMSQNTVVKTECFSEPVSPTRILTASQRLEPAANQASSSPLAKNPRLSCASLESNANLTTVTVKGREYVMIDVDTFGQILNEITCLKEKLAQLTEIIQEDQDMTQLSQTMDSLFAEEEDESTSQSPCK